MLPEALCQPQAWCRLLPLRAGSRGGTCHPGRFPMRDRHLVDAWTGWVRSVVNAALISSTCLAMQMTSAAREEHKCGDSLEDSQSTR